MSRIYGHILRMVNKLNYLLADYSHKYKICYLRKMGMRLGKNVRFNCDMKAFGSEPYLISIDDDCLIAADVRFITHDGGVKVLNTLGKFEVSMDKFGGIFIGKNVYIGMGAYIMPGVHIGNNSIIGAGAIVTKDVPNNSCYAGVPARYMCSIEDYYTRSLTYRGKQIREKKTLIRLYMDK